MSWQYYEVLTLQPDFTSAPRAGLFDERDISNLGPDGPAFIAWPGRTDRVFGFTWQTFSTTEWRVVREFFDRHSGRAKAFYLPTWNQNFELYSSRAAGSSTIEVQGNWFNTTIQDNRPDTIGRRIFMLNHLGQFSSHWVLDFESLGDHERLVLDRPIPNPIEVGRTMVGLCYFARLANDSIESEHQSPMHARFELTFREISHRRHLDQQESAPGEAIGSMEPAFDIIATDADPIYTDLTISEAIGPFGYAAPQADNFSSTWTAAINKITNQVTLTGPSGTIYSAIYDAPGVANQLALTFDASSREVLAWEIDGQIRVGWRESGVPTHLDFTGYSPVAFNTFGIDSTVDAGTATVAVFYLKRYDTTIYCRTIAEDFLTEHRYCASPLAPLYLHAARREEGRLELVGMDANHRLARWRSEGYLTPPETQVANVQLASFLGVYSPITIAVTPPPEHTSVGITSSELVYRSVWVPATTEIHRASVSMGSTMSGIYVTVVKPATAPIQNTSVTLAGTIPGSYSLVAKRGTHPDTQANVSLTSISGTYGP